jgi:enoyl-CoA hydratase
MINGHAIAGGAILAWACDLRIAARGDTKIGLNELAIGIAPPRAAYEIGRLALTHRRMWQVGLGAELHDADTARELGMLDQVVDPDDLERVCVAEARRLGSYPRDAYAYCKRMVQRDAVEAVVNETEEQVRALVEVWTSPETTRALQAQLADLSRRRRESGPPSSGGR